LRPWGIRLPPQANSIGRFNTTVRSSVDNGKTWDAGVLVEGAPSAGYSCLVKGPVVKGKGGILFESSNMTIQFAQFPLKKPPLEHDGRKHGNRAVL
jgi:hypothetical protein